MITQYEILIQHGKELYSPSVKGKVTWQTKRQGTPGKLTFSIIADNELKIEEGDAVRFIQRNENIFFGYVFEIKHDKENILSITAYDQLRYFKNKDTYVYEGKTAADVLKMLCRDFKLKTGTIEGTGYVIPSRIEENSSLFEMICNALDLTLQNTKTLYILYDDFGKISLKKISSMATDILIDESTAENFDFSSSIDSETYNKVKLTYDNDDSGKREVYIAQNGNNINKWGILQYFDTLQKDENGRAKAQTLLSLYNQKTKKLSVKNAFGSNKVRAGSLVLVRLKLYDMNISNFMLCEEVTHNYENGQHFMNLELRGGQLG